MEFSNKLLFQVVQPMPKPTPSPALADCGSRKPLPTTPYRAVARPSTATRTPVPVPQMKPAPTPTRGPSVPTPVNRSLHAEFEKASTPSASPIAVSSAAPSSRVFETRLSPPITPTLLEDLWL